MELDTRRERSAWEEEEDSHTGFLNNINNNDYMFPLMMNGDDNAMTKWLNVRGTMIMQMWGRSN